MGINSESLEPVNDIAWHYAITFSNASNEHLTSVILTYGVVGSNTPRQVEITDWPPGRVAVFDLGPCPALVDYLILITFDDRSTLSFPDEDDPLGLMTPRRASEIHPNDHFLCEDSWAYAPI